MRSQQGSAIVLAMLVSVILTLLGISFLLMSDTENRIAQNEKLASQALYAADASTRAVKHWFDHPDLDSAIPFPSPSVVRRDLRMIDIDGPGPVAPRAAGAGETYKAGIDLDGNGNEDLFERPYRGSIQHALSGTAAGPDMRIEDATFLDALSDSLLADFPAAGSGVVARISRIDIYAPPMIETEGGWARFGMGTVKVRVRILDDGRTIAERELSAVLNEAPYPGPYGPLHSCAGLTLATSGAPFPMHWGPVTALETVVIDLPPLSPGPPRSTSGFPRFDPLWGPAFGATLTQYNSRLSAGTDDLGDPWFRLVTAGTIAGGPAESQPHPPVWIGWDGVAASPGSPIDDSNVAQEQYVECPEYAYDVWKMVATSGGADVRYFAWASGDEFRENGRGVPRSFRDITDGEEGLFFFDTRDGLPPASDSSNLTPEIAIAGGTWSFRGLIYLNAASIQTSGIAGVSADFVAPGEPYEDLNQNGRFDVGDESWIDLIYPNTLSGAFTAGGGAGRQASSPNVILDTASLNGILYTNGKFEATGTARHHGSIIARSGVVQTRSDPGLPEVYWDPAIVNDWPPNGVRLPRVILTAWTTDP